MHMAAALAVGGREPNEAIVLVASDKELLAAAKSAGIGTLDPEASDALDVLKKLP